MQSTDHLAEGPLPHAPSCMGALEAILGSQYLAQRCTAPFVAAWQAVRALSGAGEDRGALLRHLTASRTLPAALRSPLWHSDSPVRPPRPSSFYRVRLHPCGWCLLGL